MIVRIDLFAPWRMEYSSAASTFHQEGVYIA
jgi:hypothetical protein